nr:uncharacterized protein LOC124214463 isoform X1 [Neodiprion pinetum]
MPCCAVSACLNRTYKKSKSQIETEKTSKITFHRFPKAENQRLKWVECTQLPLTSLPAIAYLCSVHFAEDSIDRTSLSCTRLKRDAIPAINITNTGKPENLSEHEHEHVSQVQQDVYPSTSKTIDKEIPEEIFDDFTCGKTDANTRSDLLKTLFENTPKRIHKCDVTTECKPQKRQCIQSALCEQTVQGTQVKSESSSEMTDDTYLSKSPFLINQQNNEALSDSRGQLQYTPRKILLCKTLKAQQDISRRQIQTLKKRNKRQEKKIAILNSILNELKAKQMLDEEQLDLLRTIECVKVINYQLVGTLVFDEMSIRQHVEYDVKKYSVNIVNDHSTVAKDALVFLFVCMNSSWKISIAYFLINGLSAD